MIGNMLDDDTLLREELIKRYERLLIYLPDNLWGFGTAITS